MLYIVLYFLSFLVLPFHSSFPVTKCSATTCWATFVLNLNNHNFSCHILTEKLFLYVLFIRLHYSFPTFCPSGVHICNELQSKDTHERPMWSETLWMLSEVPSVCAYVHHQSLVNQEKGKLLHSWWDSGYLWVAGSTWVFSAGDVVVERFGISSRWGLPEISGYDL